jgi:hypothetical protein
VPIGQITRLPDSGALEAGAIAPSVDARTVQGRDLAQPIRNVGATIARLLTLFALQPGNLIMTGSSEGVGAVLPGQIMRGSVRGLTPIPVKLVWISCALSARQYTAYGSHPDLPGRWRRHPLEPGILEWRRQAQRGRGRTSGRGDIPECCAILQFSWADCCFLERFG